MGQCSLALLETHMEVPKHFSFTKFFKLTKYLLLNQPWSNCERLVVYGLFLRKNAGVLEQPDILAKSRCASSEDVYKENSFLTSVAVLPHRFIIEPRSSHQIRIVRQINTCSFINPHKYTDKPRLYLFRIQIGTLTFLFLNTSYISTCCHCCEQERCQNLSKLWQVSVFYIPSIWRFGLSHMSLSSSKTISSKNKCSFLSHSDRQCRQYFIVESRYIFFFYRWPHFSSFFFLLLFFFLVEQR